MVTILFWLQWVNSEFPWFPKVNREWYETEPQEPGNNIGINQNPPVPELARPNINQIWTLFLPPNVLVWQKSIWECNDEG